LREKSRKLFTQRREAAKQTKGAPGAV